MNISKSLHLNTYTTVSNKVLLVKASLATHDKQIYKTARWRILQHANILQNPDCITKYQLDLFLTNINFK